MSIQMTTPLQTKIQMNKRLFVTVGTTKFDPLIESTTNSSFIKRMYSYGYNRFIIQYGKGIPPLKEYYEKATSTSTEKSSSISFQHDGIKFEIYTFKPSLEEDMQNADLIISHAGAGSIMEGMEHCRRRNKSNSSSITRIASKNCNNFPKDKKKLVVVINDQLMDNHQCELAQALEKRGYLYVISKPVLLLQENMLDKIIHEFTPRSFEGGNDKSFGLLVDDFMGYK
mmetsp:Transcript_24888/g.28773  ORF Transcript_24888/g.28773 Transcript_24888/m.28773 type:complete len:227 (-) Transcript_24888:60-740(-)